MKPLIKAGKKLLCVVICLITVSLISILSWYQLVRLSVAHASSDNLEEVSTSKVALVLGTTSKLKDGSPNPYFYNRMDAAAELYKAGKVRIILLSGYGGPYYSEIRDMTRALIERGIPEYSIKFDPYGLRTLDSVLRAHQVYKLNSFIIVSQRFHNHRALYICRKHGIDASGYEAKDVTDSQLWVWNSVREHLARVKMAQDLYFLDTKPQSMEPAQSTKATSVAK